MPKRRTLMISAFSLITGMTSGCASWAQVVESETGKPIEGVYAVSQWLADLDEIVRSEIVCLRVDVAKTDAAGKFEMSSSSGIVSPMLFIQRRFVTLYKAGYREVQSTDVNERPLKMERDARVGEPRMDYLLYDTGAMYCGVTDQKNKVLLPVFNAMYAEMEALAPAPTKREKAILLEMKSRVEVLTPGGAEANRNRLRETVPAGIR